MPSQRPDHVELAYSGDEQHPLVEAFLEKRWTGPRPCLDIAAADEMFDYALSEQHQHRGLALVSYLRSGLTAWESLESVARWRWGGAGPEGWLDFAAGCGRVTRFARERLSPGSLSIAELSPAAVAFQRDVLGLTSHLSATAPHELEDLGSFDFLTALSLFTHLPDDLFDSWLERLYSMLRPGGLLLFSTNGENVLFPGCELDERGFCFESVSESHELDLGTYGTTWTSSEFVRSRIEATCPSATVCGFVERGLWHFQDIWVLEKPSGDDRAPARGSGPLQLDLPAEGYLDTCVIQTPTTLQVAGWAIDRQKPAHDVEIEVSLAGEVIATVRASRLRPDLGEALGELFDHAGWVADYEASQRLDPDALLLVVSRSSSGRESVVHLSRLDGADLTRRASGGLEEVRDANLHLRARTAELEQRIEWMEQSRFWKLRNLWFRLTGRT